MRQKFLRLILILVLMSGTASFLAAADTSFWIIRANYVQTWPSSDSYQTQSVLEDLPPILGELSFDNGQGFGLEVEYLFRANVQSPPRLGLVLTAIFTDLEGSLLYGEVGEENELVKDNNTVDFYSVNFGANYHFAPRKRVDPYLGAFVGWFSHDSVKFSLGETGEEISIDFDDQFSYGVSAGLDIPFRTQGRSLMFTLGVKYLISDLKETGGSREIAIDPIIGTVGLAYRF